MKVGVVVGLVLLLLRLMPVIAHAQSDDWILDPPEPRAGDIVRFTLSLTGGARTGSGTFEGNTVPGFQTGGLLNVYFGVDLDVTAGPHELAYEMPGFKELVKGNVPVVVRPRDLATESPAGAAKQPDLDKESQERVEREAKEIDAIWTKATPERMWAKAFVLPAVGQVGPAFGSRGVFDDEPKGGPHTGIDIEAQAGADVYASNHGKIVLAKDLLLLGNTVIIDHGLGLYTVYAHLSRIDVKAGDEVDRAKVIGRVGATGLATRPHLHWAARILGARVDPSTLPGVTL